MSRKVWNKGLTSKSDIRVKLSMEKAHKTLRENYASGKIIHWSKGLTAETDGRIKKFAEKKKGMKYKLHKENPTWFKKGESSGFSGKEHTIISKIKMGLSQKKRFENNAIWNKGLKLLQFSGKNHWNWQGGKEISKKECIDCGCEINRFSIRCRPCLYRIRKQYNHPNWRGGISKEPYPFEFNQELKDKIRKRDNYQCQNKECNMTEEEHLIVYGCNLTTHHLDYDKKNCSESNLIALCNQCNFRANWNRNYWKDYYDKLLIKVR